MQPLVGNELQLQRRVIKAKRRVQLELEKTERFVEELRQRRSKVEQNAAMVLDGLQASCSHRLSYPSLFFTGAVYVCKICGKEGV